MINVCMAGATGWTGKALSFGLREDNELKLVTAVSRSNSGKDLGEVLESKSWCDLTKLL